MSDSKSENMNEHENKIRSTPYANKNDSEGAETDG